MTPLKINKKIAELKGYEVRRTKGSCLLIGKPGFDGTWVDWAKYIRDAWELFEEMTAEENDFFIMHHTDLGLYSCDSDCLNIETNERTAPLAICKAYIKWKEI